MAALYFFIPIFLSTISPAIADVLSQYNKQYSRMTPML
ncbi:hypothetical protein ETAE_1734 [Edwardsiella piscicida]|uniref:Uncharacterized protein n=1 Tax=Edwardsiella piscicida TaxID=1263550 RepID=A0AAU8P3K1_EDWPI|nr:hypothetical protein ETAE_1734 [Edwardsiella tarda EIB202]